ncbi:MAG: hypothetical protein Q8928_15635 [Bacteroidota bacterium]|nr:hypothetical protein [Bacteroidota bacterium]
MKKYKFHLIVIGILLVIAISLYLKDKPGTLAVNSKTFAVTDTSAITTIRIKAENNEVVLERSGDNWRINNSLNAKPRTINTFLKLLMNLEVSAPVANSMKKEAIGSFANSISVSVETSGKVVKSYLLTENMHLGIGSLIMLNNETEPYVVRVPGFDGQVSMLFPANPQFWRDRTIFRYRPADVLSIEVNYPTNPQRSFAYNFLGPDNLQIKSLKSTNSIKISKDIARSYLNNFASVPFETQLTTRAKAVFDSLKTQPAYCEISVKNAANQTNTVKTYRIPVAKQAQPFDLNRLYAVIQNDTVPTIIKFTDFDPIMKEFNDFTGR